MYQAFSLLESYGSRHNYLAPVYVEYSRIFRSESDVEAASFDPSRNREVREEIGVLASYANDPHMIQIKLLGDNQIMLHISDEYLAYAEENGIDQFLDFGWMRNAFIADYIADSLINAGFTSGYIASFDGFTCNLDQRGEVYTFNLFDAVGQDVYMPGQMQYTSARSIVFLRNYPMDELDRWTYYVYEDGQVTGTIVNPANGMSQTSLNNMVSYADDAGCAKVLMEMLPVFTAEVFSASAAENMAKNGVYSIWYEDAVVIYNDASLDLMLLPDTDGNLYEMKLAQ